MSGSISGTVFVNFGSAGLTALSSVVFARLLGIANFGLYVYIVSAIGLVGSFATLGLPTLITREIAAWGAIGEWRRFNGIMRFGIFATLVSAVLFGLLLLSCEPFLGEIRASPGFPIALLLGAGIMVVQCVDLAVAGILQGMHVVARSLIPQGIVLPVCLILFLVVVHSLHKPVDATRLLAVQFVVGILLETYQLASLSWRRPDRSLGNGFETHAWTWLQNALPFLGNGILFVINTQADTLLLGYFRGSESAGIYQVGTRGAQLVVLSLGAIATAMQPRLAGLHVAGDRRGINRIVTSTTRLAFVTAMAGALFLLAFGASLIRSFFGIGFISAASVLYILVFARLINASVGSLGPYLAMTGKEHLMLKGLAVEAIMNIVLNILLIPRWGLNGSAFATGISMSIVNLVQAIYIFRRWGVDTSILGISKEYV
jgi:O-antigen/teichoic acid export membrane protein